MKSRCGEHNYENISRSKIDLILKKLEENGATIHGGNPWEVDVNKHNIKMHGTWDETTSSLSIIVTDKHFIVPCSKIWKEIDPLISHLSKETGNPDTAGI
jgi:hypothetical protein